MLKQYFITLTFILSASAVFAQFADIRGQIINTDSEGDQPQYVTLALKKGTTTVASRVSDEEGRFIFSNLVAGDYTIIALYSGFHPGEKVFYLNSDESKYLEIAITSKDNVFGPVDVIYTRGIIVDDGGEGIGEEEIEQSPFINPVEGLKIDPNITFENGTIRKSDTRIGTLGVIRDNTVQIGPLAPTQLNLSQMRLIANGAPARFGDFVGGAIEYSTNFRLDTNMLFKSMLRSSSPFNPYNQNAIETYLYKPLVVKKGKTKLSVAHSIYYSFNADGNPASISLYQVNSDSKNSLIENPITNVQGGTSIPTASQFSSEDFSVVNRKQNTNATNIYSAVNFGWKPSESSLLRIEPSVHYIRRNLYSFTNSLMNAEHNPLNTSITGKLNGQFIQTLKSPYNDTGAFVYDTTSSFSKINYVIIADFQRVNSETVDPVHGRNIFNYGHVGRFETKGQDVFEYKDEQRSFTDQYGNEVVVDGYNEWIGYQDTTVSFEASGLNPHRSAFTSSSFETNDVRNLTEVNALQGLLNGQNPSSIHSMWFAPGAITTNYNKTDQTKASISAIINLSYHPTKEFKRQHDIQIGLLAEQRSRSFYSLNANALWQLMPQLLNTQFVRPDINNPVLSYDANGVFTDTVNYNWLTDNNVQTQFDARLRQLVDSRNGYQSGNAQFIDVNSVDPNLLTIDMFSADELLNNGNSYVNYAGYDHTGKLQRQRFSINDFLNDDVNRSIGSYNPIYTALWFQDKFVLKDIKFRAGFRVERFDANQSVLKDAYSLYPIKTISEVADISGVPVQHPSHLTNEAKVYVDDISNPSEVVGYRVGSKWFDAQGVQIASAEQLRIQTTQGVIQPFLVDPNNQELTSNSFEDYTPEILILPRMSFSFPISNSALFYAYYDMFAQRPSFAQSFSPIRNYYYLENAANTFLPNAGLKPSRRTDYKLGFKQILGKKSTLDILLGYAEIKNEINLMQIDQAYPRSYVTYGNIDFSTVKSLKTEYNLSRDFMDLTVAYLLQFADGTGSNVNSAAALIQANQPNLRSLYPLSYDIRHKLTSSVSFDLSPLARSGWNCIFANSGLNLYMINQSGTPYTSYLNPIAEAQNLGVASRSQIKGNPFGSRLVGNSTIDLSFTKAVKFKTKPLIFQLNVTNVLNTNNVYNVYAYSSLPDNDGFLSSPQGQQQINNELSAQSYIDYYSLKQNNPGNFGRPRVISLSIRSTF